MIWVDILLLMVMRKLLLSGKIVNNNIKFNHNTKLNNKYIYICEIKCIDNEIFGTIKHQQLKLEKDNNTMLLPHEK